MSKALDCLFSPFRFYRRLCGGRWYRVWDLPMVSGGFEIWTRSLCPDIPGKVLAIEDYGKGTFMYDLTLPKRDVVEA